jgi:hypothetical protein
LGTKEGKGAAHGKVVSSLKEALFGKQQTEAGADGGVVVAVVG